jgi:hypothetical protein
VSYGTCVIDERFTFQITAIRLAARDNRPMLVLTLEGHPSDDLGPGSWQVVIYDPDGHEVIRYRPDPFGWRLKYGRHVTVDMPFLLGQPEGEHAHPW